MKNEPRTIDRETYLKQFEGEYCDTSRKAKALEFALDIRKFEIELYWKRATYFWTFIAATFAGYGVVQTLKDPMKTDLSIVLGSLGFVFSLAWHCVNRGSKHWQVNWEKHVDILEDEVLGPLYKVIATEEAPAAENYWNRAIGWTRRLMTGATAFSVSRINQIISLFVTLIWLLLMLHASPFFGWEQHRYLFYSIVIFVTALICVVLLCVGRTGERQSVIILTPRIVEVKAANLPETSKEAQSSKV